MELLGYKIVFLLGVLNIITLLLIFFSCRCLAGAKFVEKMRKYIWYQKYYKWHCYYWWIFFISIILHTIFAMLTFGNPF